MKRYQLKIVLNHTKPPVWKRCLVPEGITFSQLSIILEEILEIRDTEKYEFEFFQRGVRIREWEEGKNPVTGFSFDYCCASDTYVNNLLAEEKWFAFQIPDGSRYRATIEAAVADESEDCPVILKQRDSAEIMGWTDKDILNDKLKKTLSVSCGEEDYRSHQELRTAMAGGETGLRGSMDARSRENRNKKSPNSLLRDLAEKIREVMQWAQEEMMDQEADEPVYDEQRAYEIQTEAETRMRNELHEELQRLLNPDKRDPQSSRNPKVKEQLLIYGKDDLRSLAEELGLHYYKSLNKDMLAEKIRNEILTPFVMEKRMLLLRDNEIEAFERVIQSGCCYPEADVLKTLETLYDLDYIAIFSDNYVEVPQEVADVYARINTPEYQRRRRQLSWMNDCLHIVEAFYGVVPVKILHRVYRRRAGCKVDFRTFQELFRQFPPERNPCVMRENKIILKVLLRDDLYREIEKSQGNKDYYIPSEEEVLDYAVNGYPSRDSRYQKLRFFLLHELPLDGQTAGDLLPVIYGKISMGEGLSDIMDLFQETGIAFTSETAVEKVVSLLMELNNNTRMLIHRGHTPNEIAGQTQAFRGGRMPTIVPMSSMAADMLREAQPELGQRGFSVDLDSNAAEIPTVFMPSGAGGERIAANRKVYPNDPCPCGSGKKYKKCCGRK